MTGPARRRWVSALLLAIAAVVAAGCSADGDEGTPSPAASSPAPAATSPSPAAEGFRTYHNEEEGFTIGYPEEWSFREDEFGVLALFAEPPVTDFAANVNVVVENIPPSVDLEQYEDATVEQLEGFITDFHGLQTRDTEIGGVPAAELTYLGSQGQFDLQWLQELIVVDGRAFVLTFTAEDDRFAEVEPTARTVLESFRLD